MDKKSIYKIHSSRHYSKIDTESLNKAVEKANKDRNFISNTVDLLKGLKFPAYKKETNICSKQIYVLGAYSKRGKTIPQSLSSKKSIRTK